MTDPDQLVVFTLENCRYAVPLPAVERAVRMVEITPLPQAPEIVLGIINLQGRIIPILNIRKRFRLPERKPGLSDQLLIARTAQRTVALVVDAVSDVIDHSPQETTAPPMIVPGLEYLAGVIKLADGMVFIHDLDVFLSLEEEDALEMALGGENKVDVPK
ncbi:MAG: purine-binding chemotaxis protein [Geobacteraceae bacterium]|nr:MAG: purine-binding chemotaxis protein [Geobacteraceae bacterium]